MYESVISRHPFERTRFKLRVTSFDLKHPGEKSVNYDF